MLNEALMSSKNLCWCTPQDFFGRLDEEFHFTLDPAATEKSAKCAKFFTPDDDGLSKDWGGETVFCKPPYGREIGKWVRKGWEESRKPGTVVVMLIPARTDTAYFHDYIFKKAEDIRFIRGRLKFTDEGGTPKDAAPFPSAVVVWRSPDMTDYDALMMDCMASSFSMMDDDEKAEWSRGAAEDWVHDELLLEAESGGLVLPWDIADVYDTIAAMIETD